jgi:hypothetical protein
MAVQVTIFLRRHLRSSSPEDEESLSQAQGLMNGFITTVTVRAAGSTSSSSMFLGALRPREYVQDHQRTTRMRAHDLMKYTV